MVCAKQDVPVLSSQHFALLMRAVFLLQTSVIGAVIFEYRVIFRHVEFCHVEFSMIQELDKMVHYEQS